MSIRNSSKHIVAAMSSKWQRVDFGWRIFPRSRKQQGMTLIEVVIALTLLTGVVSVAIPSWLVLQQKWERDHLRFLAIISAQNELVKFEHGLVHDHEERTVYQNEHAYQVYWTIEEEIGVQKGEVVVSWESQAEKEQQLHFTVYRIKKE